MPRARALLPLLTLLLSLAPGLLSPAAAREATPLDGAQRFIDDLAARATRVLADPSATPQAREASMRNLLEEGLDLEVIGRFALGRSWQTATPAQRTDYQKLFRDYVLGTYARRLTAYSGERFKITGAQPIAGSDAVVLSVIERPKAQPASVNWRVRAEDGRYKVIDVMVEGVSMALTQRQEFAAVVQSKGMNGLLASLRNRLEQLAAGASPQSAAK